MEILAIKNKDSIINSYGTTPTLPFDVEGVLLEKNGKNIKIEKTLNNKVVEYSLRLKEEVEENLGQDIKVRKEDIVSYKVEEKEEKTKDTEETVRAEEIISELGLEYTEENIRMIEHLLKNGIQITKTNIKSYVKSREYLNKVIDKLDTTNSIKLMQKGINLEEESLQKIAEALESIEDQKPAKFLRKILKLDKELTYKEAEIISKEIYGQKMGKDIYDTIIQLHKEDLPITKENIDKTMEVLKKLKNLKTVENDSYVKILNEEKKFNIENLYRENNSYTTTSINVNQDAKDFESFTILEETNIDNLKTILSDLEIEETGENLNILREFIVNDMNIDKDKYEEIISMKTAVKDLLELLDTKDISKLNRDDRNILEENIYSLVDEFKKEDIAKRTVIESTEKEIDTQSIEKEIEVNTDELKEQLKNLGDIKDKDLLNLIKKGEDFNLKSIKNIIETDSLKGSNIEEKTLGKTIHISKIFNSLGEKLNSSTISFTLRNQEITSLENLYKNEGIADARRLNIEENKQKINLIQEEYLKLRNSLTTNMVKESIKEGKIIERMPINELNKFIEKKINRYKEISEITKDIKSIKGNEEKVIPLIMKNNLEMTIKEIRNINSFLNGEKGLVNILKDTTNSQNPKYREEYKEAIKLLGEKVSNSIKNGDKGFKEDYKELINTLDNPKGEHRDNKDNPKRDEYIKIQKKLSKKDMVLQIPIKIDNEYKSLNLIVADVNKGVDKNNMRFFISLTTDNLGLVDMDIQVKGKEVEISMTEENLSISNRIVDLKKSLDKIGYRLNV